MNIEDFEDRIFQKNNIKAKGYSELILRMLDTEGTTLEKEIQGVHIHQTQRVVSRRQDGK